MKPRALVSTTFEVVTFKTRDSLICDELEEKLVPSSDDELMTKKAIEEDEEGTKTMGREKEEMKKKKHDRGIKCKAEEIVARKRMEELKRAYKRRINLYKTKYKV